jgi:hypothetical protein
MLKQIVLSIIIFLMATGIEHALADEKSVDDSRQIPDQLTSAHWAYKEIKALEKKYAPERILPEAADGKMCPVSEAARCFISILDRIAKQDMEHREAISREDLDRVAVLRRALEKELLKYPEYLSVRENIDEMLGKPEESEFVCKGGVNGFLRGEATNNFKLKALSYTPNHSEGRFLYRIKPYVYWHPTDYLDIHLEGQGYGYTGSEHTSKYSLYQGFVEAKIPEHDWLALKVGRQEFLYGSTFILGTNSFFSGLTFDAARLRLKPLLPLTIDLLGGRYAVPFSNGLRGNLAGGYATYAFSEGNAAEAYVFSDAGLAAYQPGEHLNIWGLRGTAKFDAVSIEFEPVYESGRISNPVTGANDNIKAYGGHVDVTVDATVAGYHNNLFASYALGSGNKEAANGVRFGKEFRNPDNDSSLIGDAHVVGDLSGLNVSGHHASGLQIYTLGWGIDLTKKLHLSATGHYFFANAVENGLSKNLGLEADFNLAYQINGDFSVLFAFDHFFTGQFICDASGSDKAINYGYVLFQFNFDRTKPKARKI